MKNYSLDIYTLREVDDDLPNYCHDKDGNGTSFESNADFDIGLMPNCMDPIPSTEHICIDPGEDGSVDLSLDISSYLRGKNEIVEIPANGKVKVKQNSVKAGVDKKCDTRPYRSGFDGPFKFSEYQIDDAYSLNQSEVLERIESVNLFYNRIGVNFIPNWNTMQVNFDFEIDDNEMSYSKDVDKEFTTFTHQLYGITINSSGDLLVVKPDNPVLFLITDLEEKGSDPASGLSTTKKNIALAEDFLSEIHWITTVAHELGHGAFGLRHPIDQFGKTDSGNFMKSTIDLSGSEELLDLSSKYYQWVFIHK